MGRSPVFLLALALFLTHLCSLETACAKNRQGLLAKADDMIREKIARRWYGEVYRPTLKRSARGGKGRLRAPRGLDGFAMPGSWWLKRSAACRAWVAKMMAKRARKFAKGKHRRAEKLSRGLRGRMATRKRLLLLRKRARLLARRRKDNKAAPADASSGSASNGEASDVIPAELPSTGIDNSVPSAEESVVGLDGFGGLADGIDGEEGMALPATGDWVFLGDSLTVGMVGDGSSFAKDLEEVFGAKVSVVNTSRVGKHVTEYVSEIDAILARYPEARFFPFLIGANDVLQFSESRAQWLRSKLVIVLDKIVAAGRIPILMRMSYRRTKGGDPLAPFNTNVYDPLIRKYSPPWFDEASGQGLIDLHGFLKSHPEYLAGDGVHFTGKGYREARRSILVEIMAAVVYGK